MEFKVLVMSNRVLNGQIRFDLHNVLSCFAHSNNAINQLSLLEYNKSSCKTLIESEHGNLIVFCENALLDELILESINLLGNDRFMIDELAVVFNREGSKVAFIPVDLDCYIALLDKVLQQQKDKEFKYCTFRLFGKSVDEVVKELETLQNPSLTYNVLNDGILTDIYVSYKGEDNLIDNEQVKIANIFKDNLYSENELGLEETIYQVLKLKNLKLAIREGISGGTIIASLFSKRPEFSELLSLCEIVKLEGLEPEKLYDEAYNILKTQVCDIAMVTGGSFDEKGLNFILAIGDKNVIHVFKSRFNADNHECLKMASQSALFHLVKKIRQNDFAF